MRRVFAIGLAILVVMLATRGVVAQETEQSVSDRLLEILKDRQIISQDEYGELAGLADQMRTERSEIDQRLGDLDRSISDYLAKSGDGGAANVTHTPGLGFNFATADGLFLTNLGGLFQFYYEGTERERDQYPYYDRRDRNNFDMGEVRFHFLGHAFDPNFQFFIQYAANSSVSVLDAWVQYNLCNWTNVRAGHMKAPISRQAMTDAGKLQMGRRAFYNSPWRDTGIMFFNQYVLDYFGEMFKNMTLAYWLGFFDGDGASMNNWFAPVMRLELSPFGAIPYTEGLANSDQFKCAVAANYGHDKGPPHDDTIQSVWGVDGVIVWTNLFLTGEWQRTRYDERGMSGQHDRMWFIQGGWVIMPETLEIFARYTKYSYWLPPMMSSEFEKTTEWAAGLAYYFAGHPWKAILEIGQMTSEYVDMGSSTPDDLELFFLRILIQLMW